ncbi:MAG: tRNA-queuosine alpha-mannosyltransferase domain-containing protein [Flavobacteriales bacterium]
MTAALHVWILDPFHTGSHRAWSCGVSAALETAGHRVALHTLPGRHWKWRMHGAAAVWADMMTDNDVPDVVITTDMCDVAQLRGRMPSSWSKVKVVTMFHENQLTFPWSPDDPDATNGRDNTYGYINASSGLASDALWFNSNHHMNAFLGATEAFMKRMPKPQLLDVGARLAAKSEVVHLGMTLANWPSPSRALDDLSHVDTPKFLWNHRWAWDKGTDAWMAFVDGMLKQNLPGEFIVLGESFGRKPEGWEALKDQMGARCLHWGYAESRDEYVRWLWESHIAPVHPKQEYFGLAVVEAMRCRTLPWVPKEHAYVDTMPVGHPFVPAPSWLDAVKEAKWKSWDVPLEKYEARALEFDWKVVGPACARRLEQLCSDSVAQGG